LCVFYSLIYYSRLLVSWLRRLIGWRWGFHCLVHRNHWRRRRRRCMFVIVVHFRSLLFIV